MGHLDVILYVKKVQDIHDHIPPESQRQPAAVHHQEILWTCPAVAYGWAGVIGLGSDEASQILQTTMSKKYDIQLVMRLRI
jgi:hypothetical protein